MDVAIVNFNTPEITAATVKSVWKHTPGARVTVFDNSTERPMPKMDGVFLMDNTKGQLINFDAFLAKYPNKGETSNDWGSDKHCSTIDYLWGVFPAGFILLDSDALVKRDLSDIVDPDKAFVGEVFQDFSNPWHWLPRVLPFCCWINVPLCRKTGIRYFGEDRNWRLHRGDNRTWYDTGASFYEDVLDHRLPRREIKVEDYVEHLGGGSYRQPDPMRWLEENRSLYE